MRACFLLFLLCLLYGCSSSKHKWNTIETKHTFVHDPLTQTSGMTASYVGVDKLTQDYLKSGRINQKSELSCLRESPVFNFINVSKEYVPLFRPYLIDNEKEIKYSKVEGFRNGAHGSLYKEEVKDNLRVKTKVCFKDFEGERVMVVTEYYFQEKK